jgi:monoamine oxidase
MSVLGVLDCAVLIVGAGVAGASAAYHLAAAGVKDVLVLDCGRAGEGSMTPTTAPPHSAVTAGNLPHDGDAGEYMHAGRSGSGVMRNTRAIKMMITMYRTPTVDFIKHHGEAGARLYLQISTAGLAMQVKRQPGTTCHCIFLKREAIICQSHACCRNTYSFTQSMQFPAT